MANKKIRIRLKAYKHRTLDTAAAKSWNCYSRAELEVAGYVLPTERENLTSFGSQIQGSREQFEMRTHKRLIDIINPTQKTVYAFDEKLGWNVQRTWDA